MPEPGLWESVLTAFGAAGGIAWLWKRQTRIEDDHRELRGRVLTLEQTSATRADISEMRIEMRDGFKQVGEDVRDVSRRIDSAINKLA